MWFFPVQSVILGVRGWVSYRWHPHITDAVNETKACFGCRRTALGGSVAIFKVSCGDKCAEEAFKVAPSAVVYCQSFNINLYSPNSISYHLHVYVQYSLPVSHIQ